MVRIVSFLAAIVVLLGAAAEVVSFAIDHQSWIKANAEAVREYVVAVARSKPFEAAKCEAEDCATLEQARAPRCGAIEPLGERVLCYLTIPMPRTACPPQDCARKDKPPLPGDWIRNGQKGDVASGPALD